MDSVGWLCDILPTMALEERGRRVMITYVFSLSSELGLCDTLKWIYMLCYRLGLHHCLWFCRSPWKFVWRQVVSEYASITLRAWYLVPGWRSVAAPFPGPFHAVSFRASRSLFCSSVLFMAEKPMAIGVFSAEFGNTMTAVTASPGYSPISHIRSPHWLCSIANYAEYDGVETTLARRAAGPSVRTGEGPSSP